MTTIKTIADFKRAMTPKTIWETTHRYIGDRPSAEKSLGVRECALNNSVGFGFQTENGISHADWPKRAEFSTEENGRVVVITKEGFVQLKYTQHNQGA